MSVDTYRLSDLASDHPVLPDLFTVCFACAAQTAPGTSQAFDMKIRHADPSSRMVRGSLVIQVPRTVTPRDIEQYTRSVAAKTITEHAAIAVAAAALTTYARLTIVDVTEEGDRGDYWLSDRNGRGAGLIEVSGTMNVTLAPRYRKKRRQVLRNRGARRCYVSVTRFSQPKGYFSRVR